MTRLQEPFTFVQVVLKTFVSKKLFVLTITGIIFLQRLSFVPKVNGYESWRLLNGQVRGYHGTLYIKASDVLDSCFRLNTNRLS